MTRRTSSLARQAASGVMWTSLATGLQGALQAAALVLLARLMSPNEFGLFAACLLVTGVSSIFVEFGVGPALVQRPHIDSDCIRVGFTLSLLLSVVITAILCMLAPVFAAFFGRDELVPAIRVIALVCMLHGASLVAEALTQRALRFQWLALVDATCFGAGFVGVGTLLAWHGFGMWSLVFAHLTQHGLRAVLLIVGRPHPARPLMDRLVVLSLLDFGTGFTIARICNYLAGQGDNFVVGHWLGSRALGIYAQAYQLMTVPAIMVGQVLDRVLFPTMALVQMNPERLAKAYRSSVALCALIVLPASFILAILAPEIISVLLGPAWTDVVGPFRILAVGMLFRTSYKLSDSVARAMGAVYRRAWRQAIFAACVILGSIAGLPWGPSGVAWSVVVSISLNFVLMAQLSLDLTRMGAREFVLAHMPAIALSGVLVGPCWALVGWLRAASTPPAVLLAETLAVALLVTGGLCWAFPAVFLGRNILDLIGAILPEKALRVLPAGGLTGNKP